MKKKPFDLKTYKNFDKPARDIVRKWLDSHGYYSLINPKEDYEADIKAIRVVKGISGPIKAHEVEVKKKWTGEWPKEWETLHILERKGRLLENNKFIFFWVISGDYQRAVVVEGKYLTSRILEVVPNSEVAEGEKMYCIPISSCSQKDMKNFIEKK